MCTILTLVMIRTIWVIPRLRKILAWNKKTIELISIKPDTDKFLKLNKALCFYTSVGKHTKYNYITVSCS